MKLVLLVILLLASAFIVDSCFEKPKQNKVKVEYNTIERQLAEDYDIYSLPSLK